MKNLRKGTPGKNKLGSGALDDFIYVLQIHFSMLNIVELENS